MRELSQALVRAEYENRRARFVVQLSGALDLDDVLARTLEAAQGLPGIDSAMIVLPQASEGPLVATHGMSREEARSQPIAPPPESRQARAVSLNYRYAEPDAGRDGNLIRGGLMVPLVGLREQFIGTLAVFWRGRERDASSEEVQLMEELAATAGPAIENAKRYLEARSSGNAIAPWWPPAATPLMDESRASSIRSHRSASTSVRPCSSGWSDTRPPPTPTS